MRTPTFHFLILHVTKAIEITPTMRVKIIPEGFGSKPTKEQSPLTLSIIGDQNSIVRSLEQPYAF